ncbi:hypothetical protein QYE76_046420 [Lolium multiflorum]|uniref:Uncharacterized protein n=1 Tax=Lolium multiflorum TaxID=4521 RepID=A0AAD8TPR1_LOLMU|nr:hypothetical protein QYE76_046420 [Lolium multiflorum]
MLLSQVTCNTPLTKVTKHKQITPSALFELLMVFFMRVVYSGNLLMEEKKIQQNIQMSTNFLVFLLKNWQNVRCLYIKRTMGKPLQFHNFEYFVK